MVKHSTQTRSLRAMLPRFCLASTAGAFLVLILALLAGCTMYVTPVTMQPIVCIEGEIHNTHTGETSPGFRCEAAK